MFVTVTLTVVFVVTRASAPFIVADPEISRRVSSPALANLPNLIRYQRNSTPDRYSQRTV